MPVSRLTSNGDVLRDVKTCIYSNFSFVIESVMWHSLGICQDETNDHAIRERNKEGRLKSFIIETLSVLSINHRMHEFLGWISETYDRWQDHSSLTGSHRSSQDLDLDDDALLGKQDLHVETGS